MLFWRRTAGKIYTEWYDKTLKDGEGNVVGLICIGQDVTERRKTEDELKESEAKYRAIVDQSFVGIGIAKGNHVIFANNALLKIFNYDNMGEFLKFLYLTMLRRLHVKRSKIR